MPTKTTTTTYRLPIRYSNLNAAEMLFWDAVYYLLATHGWTDAFGVRRVDTNNARLEELTGLSRRQIGTLRQKAAKQKDPGYRMVEEESPEPWGYILVLENFDAVTAKHVIEKPRTYIENGWGPRLDYPEGRHSRFPLAVVNHLFRLPPDRSVTPQELTHRCKHPRRKKPPDVSEIHKALSLLGQLGLVELTPDDEYRLIRSRFNLPAAEVWQQVSAAETEKPPAVQTARHQDEARATLALNLIALSADIDRLIHFEEIFRDLRYLPPEALPLLERRVRLERGKADSPDWWRTCWVKFQADLRAEEKGFRRVASAKVKLDLTGPEAQEIELALATPADLPLVWAKVTVWLDSVNASLFGLSYRIVLQLRFEGEIIWQRVLTEEDETVRRDLTRQLQQQPQATCWLRVEPDQPLRRLSLAAQIEAQVRQ